MPKRGRDSDDGVWVTVSQSPERSAMVQHPDALQLPLPDALPAPAILMRCPYPVCSMCQWKVPPEQHSCYATIYAAYEALVRTLQDEVGLTAADKCRQSQLLNFQLQSMERLLFDKDAIKAGDQLKPIVQLRTAAAADGAWGMIGLPGMPSGREADGRAAGSAAAADGAEGDEHGDGDKKKKNRKKKAKPTLESFDAYSERDWEVYCRDNDPRLDWLEEYTYEVWVDTDEGKKKYEQTVMDQLLAAYWRGARRVEIDVTVDDGRHAGHKHRYVVFWIAGTTGMQFNLLVKDAAARTVTLTKTKLPTEPQPAWPPTEPQPEWGQQHWW